jgi:lipopolysaccharide export system permease protein
MPILWRYLLAQYLKVLIFCGTTFVILLVTLRLEEIAHFASLGAIGINVARFIWYQIPYILPIALPISALIASIITFRGLSKRHELTAFRAAGFPLSSLIAPLLIAAGFISVINFYIVSEQATHAHLSASMIKSELRSINPLLLVNNKHLMKLKGIYVDTLGPSRLGESASQLIVAMPNRSNERINLLIAGGVQATPQEFHAQEVTLLTTFEDGASTKCNDRLYLENLDSTTISAQDFSQIVQKKIWTVNNDHLTLSLLSVRLEELKNSQQKSDPTDSESKHMNRQINRVYSEITRRISVGFAPLSFTLMGCCCGMSIGRRQSTRGIAIVIILAALYLTAYFSARSIDHLLLPSTLLFSVPHFLIMAVSLWMLKRISRGVE